MSEDHEAYARIQHGAWLPGPHLEAMPRPRRRWPWVLLGIALGLMAGLLLASAAHAIPACWQVSPNAEVPWTPDATAIDCGGKQAFVLDGVGAWEGNYLELPESSLWIHGVSGADQLAPYIVWSYFSMTGPAVLVNPNLYVTQWLLGSDVYPHSAEWAHANGFMPQWGPYPVPTPLGHSPEPSTLVLLASGMGLVFAGWHVRRA